MSLFAMTARALINTWCEFHIKLLRTLVFCCRDCDMDSVVINRACLHCCVMSFFIQWCQTF